MKLAWTRSDLASLTSLDRSSNAIQFQDWTCTFLSHQLNRWNYRTISLCLNSNPISKLQVDGSFEVGRFFVNFKIRQFACRPISTSKLICSNKHIFSILRTWHKDQPGCQGSSAPSPCSIHVLLCQTFPQGWTICIPAPGFTQPCLSGARQPICNREHVRRRVEGTAQFAHQTLQKS